MNKTLCVFAISGHNITAEGAKALLDWALSSTSIISFSCFPKLEGGEGRIDRRKEGVMELARGWIKHKEMKEPLTRLLMCFEKYLNAIEYVLQDEDLSRSDLAVSFKQEYDMEKFSATFLVAYGITKNAPPHFQDVSTIIDTYLSYSDIKYEGRTL